MNTEIQVDSNYYAQPKYGTVERFISYQHQIETIRASGVKQVLFIGAGDGLVPYYLRSVLGVDVTICDIDPALKPDIVADVRQLPCADESFEAVVIFEVLEHLPFEDFPKALQELARVSKGKVFISLPYRNVAFEVMIKFPGIRTLLKRPWLHFILHHPIKFLGFEYSKQHYWEIDTVTNKERVEGVISQFFNITRRAHTVFDPYRYFIDVTKKTQMSNEYARTYYDEFLRKLPIDYKSARWFSSPAAKLDYTQTHLAIKHALHGVTANRALEVGPGDGVWTELFIPKAASLTLLDQSTEMLERAKVRLKDVTKIEYVRSDFLAYQSTTPHELVCAIRCFEYFEDKEKAMQQFASLVSKDGTLVIVTKNPKHARMKKVQEQELHRGQITKEEMKVLLEKYGFTLEKTLSATWRLKANYAPMRFMFKWLQWLHTQTNGLFVVPFMTEALTESYLYVAKRR